MRLLIATPLYPPESGGPATYARLLEQGFGSFDIETQVVKFSDVRGKPKVLRHIVYLRRVYAAGKHADVILALDPVSVGFPALLAARLLRKPFIVKIVGDYAWEQGVQRFGIADTLDDFVLRKDVPLGVRFFRALQRHVARGAVACIVPSNYLKRIVQTWGISEASIEVIYNAMRLEEGGIVPEEVRKAPEPRIISVGRLVPWKGMKELISAVAKLSTQASLSIVGDGPDRAMLEAHARETLGDRCVFTGALNHADTIATVKEADIFVLNSTYEGLSHVLIEASMLGKAIIATDAGGNAEVITNDVDGLLIPPQNQTALIAALERMLADTALRSRLGASAAENRARFEPEVMLKETAAFLHTL